jgi:hypothetical protein
MARFKFMLDQGVSHLSDCFPSKRVVTMEMLGLRPTSSDDEIVEWASDNSYLLVTSNRRDFQHAASRYVRQSSKKQFGCRRVPGMILLVPNDEITQRRVLTKLEARLRFEGKQISYRDVHDRDLLVTIEASGKVTVSRLPRCPHCKYDDEESK